MTTLLSDEELIRTYLRDNPNYCFETLYKRYVNKVYRRCLSMTRSSVLATDFTHDVFVKAFTKLSVFQERSSFSTWLYAITYNYCSDRLRLAKRLETCSIEEVLSTDIPDVSDNEVYEEMLELTRQTLAGLSTEEQTLLQLKYQDGLSIHEIAHSYRLNPSAVKMRLKRIRDKFRRLFVKLCE